MKRFCLLILMASVLLASAFAQGGRIKDLEKKRKELQEQIARSEALLSSTSNDVQTQLRNLNALTNQIKERRQYIEAVEQDMVLLNREIASLQAEVEELEKELNRHKEKYASSVRHLRKNNNMEEKILFIFSGKTLSQSYRRMRYVREYADYQRRQGEEVMRRREEIDRRKQELEELRGQKTTLLEEGKQEQVRLELQEKERKRLLTSLQKKQSSLQGELKRQRREATKLNAQIDKLIEDEIARSRKQSLEQAKKGSVKAKKEDASKNAKAGSGFVLNEEDQQLAGSFVKNKGALPMPITGPCRIAVRYGQYNVEGLRNVTLDNKGIDIEGDKGAKARAVFDGEVSEVFRHGSQYGILVRHGDYISVYCNLARASVKKGDKVKTRDELGDIQAVSDKTVLHFQLRKEVTKLNPEAWLRK